MILSPSVNESKLSGSSPFSKRQTQFYGDLQNGITSFTTRSVKFGRQLPQGSTVIIESVVSTVSDGNVGGTLTMSKLF